MAEKNTNNKKKRRLDSNRIALKAGESQRPNGTYCYRYRSRDGKVHAIYAKTLEELRDKEKKLCVDLYDGVRTDGATLTVNEMSKGIVSLYILAFIAGGMNVIYQIERLPLMVAILIHGGVLYISYLCTYLLNGWLEWGITPILIFSGIFILGYLVVWIIIYSVNKKNTDRLNEIMNKKRLTE